MGEGPGQAGVREDEPGTLGLMNGKLVKKSEMTRFRHSRERGNPGK